MAKPRAGAKLSVFKGREARLNRAIFQALALKEPQTIYDITKQIRKRRGLGEAKYACLNKRIRSLSGNGYVRIAGVRRTRAGFEASTYELTIKSYVAIFLSSISLEELLSRLDEETGSEVLASILKGLDRERQHQPNPQGR